MATRAREAAAPRVALAADDARTAHEVAHVAAARGYPLEQLGLEAAVDAPVGAVAWAPASPPDLETAARLAPICQRAAENRRPVVVLAAFERARAKVAEERAAALSWLRAHGAVITEDPDVWFETAVLLAAWGAPAGPRVAIIAPPGGWLHVQGTALSLEDEARGGARTSVSDDTKDSPPADVVLVDATLAPIAPDRVARALVVPVVARAEQLDVGDGRPILVGLRAAVTAAQLAGRLGERLVAGLGPAPVGEVRRLKADRERADRQLSQGGERLGDHEAKLLLSAYGVPVTRQSVASTPSRAVQIAIQCGWPVEVKAWDPAAAPERPHDAPLVVSGVKNPPDVRRAYASAPGAAGLKVGVPVIVRATPPAGRELAARVERLESVGWTVLCHVPGVPRVLTAPAPLRRIDAEELASALESSRAGDAPPDRAALAELLLRASFVAVEREADLDAVDLPRIVVAARGDGAMVVDARVRLRRSRKTTR